MKHLSILLIVAALILTACEDGGKATAPADDSLLASVGLPATGYDCAEQTEIPQLECEGLVTLYNSTDGPNWTDDTGWLFTLEPCGWYGVVCWDGRVTQLALNSNELNGSIPAELGNLSNLNYLGLGDNQLSGPIPATFGNLTSLVGTHLFNNQLSGPIPPELGNLSNLEGVQAGSNQLSGPIPPELGNLSNLTTLNFGYNQLSGGIPVELGNLTKLEALHLQANQLTGAIPTELGNLSQLGELELYQNRLSGTIPTVLGDLTNLYDLLLAENQLVGPIPASLGNLTSLVRLELHDNQLTGPIPASLGNLSLLQSLWLADNYLSGLVPIEVARLGGSEPTSLHCAFVSGNDLLYMPNTQPYRDADQDSNGSICFLALTSFVPVAIDIRPGSCPNPVSMNARGVIPVAIVGSETFDVAQVDPASVRLEGRLSPLRWSMEDVASPFVPVQEDAYDCTEEGPDGYQDLTLKFDNQELVAPGQGQVEVGDVYRLTVTGNLKDEYGGGAIEGHDVVVIRAIARE
jgi:hypothetical protein